MAKRAYNSLRFDPVSYVVSGMLQEAFTALTAVAFAVFVDVSKVEGLGVSMRAYNCLVEEVRRRRPLTTGWGFTCSGVTRCGWMLDRRCGFLAHLALLQDRDREAKGSGALLEGTLVLYRWRWLPPLVPKDTVEGTCALDAAASIGVVRASRTGGVLHAPEPACPASCPSAAASSALAASLVALYSAHTHSGVRVVVSGPPGCGKSMAARIAAHKMGATLVAEYQPDGQGTLSMLDIVARTCPSAARPVVVVWNEFDQCVRRYRYNFRARFPIELATKGDHTDLMDYLQFQPHVVLVMTTNMTTDNLRRLDKRHGNALFRSGRITAMFRMTSAGTHHQAGAVQGDGCEDEEDASDCGGAYVEARGGRMRAVWVCLHALVAGTTATVIRLRTRG